MDFTNPDVSKHIGFILRNATKFTRINNAETAHTEVFTACSTQVNIVWLTRKHNYLSSVIKTVRQHTTIMFEIISQELVTKYWIALVLEPSEYIIS